MKKLTADGRLDLEVHAADNDSNDDREDVVHELQNEPVRGARFVVQKFEKRWTYEERRVSYELLALPAKERLNLRKRHRRWLSVLPLQRVRIAQKHARHEGRRCSAVREQRHA